LRRLGGAPLELDGTEIPAYHDPEYDCTMELLRFDSRRPHAKYQGLIQRLQDKLCNVPVIATAVAAERTGDAYDLVEVGSLPALA
jgi:hypothetical protein